MPCKQPVAAELRTAHAGELDVLTELWIELAHHHREAGPRFDLGEPGPALRRTLRGELEARLADPDCWFGVAARPSPVGFCIARILRRPGVFRETRRGEIEAIFVGEASRGVGLGAALCDAALRWLASRGISRVELAVDRSNESGRRFWRAQGFESAMDVLERRL